MMKMRTLTFYFACLFLPILAIAQPAQWEGISEPGEMAGFEQIGYSENLDLVIYLWGMNHEDGNFVLAGFNSEGWHILSDSITYGMFTFVDWEDGILVGGSLAYVGDQTMPRIAYYDGNTWTYPWEFNNVVRKLKVVNDTLFAIGSFSEIDGIENPYVSKLAGDVWEPVIPDATELDEWYPKIKDIAFYNGDYYISGLFSVSEPDYFGKVENGMLVQAGQPIIGPAGVLWMEEFLGELYLSGGIDAAQGNPGSNIIKYNGEVLSGLNGTIFYGESGQTGQFSGTGTTIAKHGDYLYALGDYYYINDQPIHGVARWDGVQWCELYTQDFIQDIEFYQPFQGLTFYGDTLIIAKAYFLDIENDIYDALWAYDTTQEPNFCYTPVLSVDNPNLIKSHFSPNPMINESWLYLEEVPSENVLFSLYDSSGRLIKTEIIRQESTKIQRDHLETGLYIYQLTAAGQLLSSGKVVVE